MVKWVDQKTVKIPELEKSTKVKLIKMFVLTFLKYIYCHSELVKYYV